MKIEVLNKEGNSTGRQVDLPADVFGVEPNEHAVYLAVKQYHAAQRQGTHKSKEKGEITASTKKIKRQKGTGTARAGSVKSGIFRGGGRMFGPRPRNYSIKLNKKVKSIARNSALTSKLSAGQIMVVEDFSFDAPKTKDFASILQNLKVADQKTLLVTGDHDQIVHLSSRNLAKAKVTAAKDINVYDVLNAKTIILSEKSVEKIKETFA